MKRFFLLFVVQLLMLPLFTDCIYAQDKVIPMSFGINYSRHGSGDIDGVLFNFEYNRKIAKKLSLIHNFGIAVHWGKELFFSETENQNLPPDSRTAAPLWTTTGVQISPIIAYHFSKKEYSGFKIGVGPVLRYQLNGYPDAYNYYGPNNLWYRQAFYVIRETDDNRLNLGYSIRFLYDFKLVKRHFWGLNTFYQNDTNGDVMVGFGLRYVYNFK